MSNTLTALARAKFRVKINSLAEEARIIRREERRALSRFRYGLHKEPCPATEPLWRPYGDYKSLRDHRTGIVRDESRATQLAYAFCRGVPFLAAGTKARPEDVRRVADIVKSLTGLACIPATIVNWMQEAAVVQ